MPSCPVLDFTFSFLFASCMFLSSFNSFLFISVCTLWNDYFSFFPFLFLWCKVHCWSGLLRLCHDLWFSTDIAEKQSMHYLSMWPVSFTLLTSELGHGTIIDKSIDEKHFPFSTTCVLSKGFKLQVKMAIRLCLVLRESNDSSHPTDSLSWSLNKVHQCGLLTKLYKVILIFGLNST